jgi:hypothetical protein
MIMRRSFFVSLTLLVVLVCAHSEAQEQAASMQIGPVKVLLGMPKSEVQNNIAGLGVVKTDEDSWTITNGRSDVEVYGNIQFTNGRVTYVGRSWLTKNSDAVEAILAAINSFNQEGLTACTILHNTVSTPAIAGERAIIGCGAKRLLIIKSKLEGRPFEDITEQIGEMK